MSVFEGVPQYALERQTLETGISLLDFLSVQTSIFPSKSEARRMVESGGMSFNKEKITDPNTVVDVAKLINGKYMLIQKGKKNYFVVIIK